MAKKWTDEDESILLLACNQESKMSTICADLKRTTKAVIAKAHSLGAGYYTTARGELLLKESKTSYGSQEERLEVITPDGEMVLNRQQQTAYDEILHGNSKIVVLTGKAGTGKSAVTSQIVKHYPKTVGVTSSTNKAKENLAQMCGVAGSTIHSFTGYILQRSGYKMVLAEKRKHTQERVSLLIIDEAPMTPKIVYNSVLKLLEQGIVQKVLLVGDDVQLEAVGEGLNLAAVDGMHIELTEQMRQSDSHPEVARYLNDVRSTIETGTTDKTNIPAWPKCDDIQFTDDYKEFAKLYKECDTDKKCIAYRNSVVDKMNLNINNATDKFSIGDDLVIDSPLNKSTPNGSIVKVTKVVQHPTDDKLILTVATSRGAIEELDHWHTKASFDAHLHKAKSLGNKEQYWYLKDRNVGVKHLFASTVHKAQGSSYSTVFIDISDIWSAYATKKSQWNNPITLNACMRLIYVAMSRMRVRAVCFTGATRKYELLS